MKVHTFLKHFIQKCNTWKTQVFLLQGHKIMCSLQVIKCTVKLYLNDNCNDAFSFIHSQECVAPLNMRELLSVGMDGPNVNFKFMELLQAEHAELYGGSKIISVGSCGLHTLHNAMKAGFNVWHLDKLLRTLHFVFHYVPARREDYTTVTGSSSFPLAFCGHRWVENVPVAERAIQVWPALRLYVNAAEKRKVTTPATASYDTLVAKLHFFLAVARSFNPFLTKFQTDEPVLPFLAGELSELLMVIHS